MTLRVPRVFASSFISAALHAVVLAIALFVVAKPAAALAEHKIALVIGNSQYQKVQVLVNPANDAADMAASLQRLGFSVKHFTDLDYDGFRRALIEFGQAAKTADKAVIFYAGHGVEIDGKNWLIPVDAEVKSEIDVYAEGINLETLIDLSVLPKVVGLIVLDACRNNPFAQAQAQADGRAVNVPTPQAGDAAANPQQAASAAPPITASPAGLAPVDVTDNVLVAFSAAAGTSANDGVGRNSPYSGALLRYIEKPKLEINYLFRDVHDDVLKATLNTQEPAVYGSLSKDEIYLKEGEALMAAAEAESAAEKLAWSFVRATNDIAVLRRFSAQFPASPHRAEVVERTAQLEKAEQFAWEMVERAHSSSAFQAFLDLYPFGDHAEKARVTLASLASSPDAGDTQAADLPQPPPQIYTLASIETDTPSKANESSEAIEKAWDVLKEARDEVVVSKFSQKYPSSRQHRLAPGSDFALRPVNSTEWMLKTAGDADVNRCFAGESADCVKAIEKYPDYVQLRFQLCRTQRRAESADANKQRPSSGCMQDAVDDARARGYLVSAFTRSKEEQQRNQEYRVAVQHVQQNVGNIVSDTVSRVVSTVVGNAVSNAVSAATSAAVSRSASFTAGPPAPMLIPLPTARWDARLGNIKAGAVAPNTVHVTAPTVTNLKAGPQGGANAAGNAATNAATNAASKASSNAASKASSAVTNAASKASSAASGAASNAAGKAASSAASNAASKAASSAASNAASKAASSAASNAASKAASNAASNAASKAASSAASNAASKAASNAASSAASKAASNAASNAASRAASNAASKAASNAAANAASRAASNAASKAASNAAASAAGRVSIPSDIRLKQDITAIGRTRDGLTLYRYRYIGDRTYYVGVMAQEVAERRPDAVARREDGYLEVDYGRLGLPFMTYDEWVRRSAKAEN